MSVEKFIKGKIDSCRHAGRASERRRLDAIRSVQLCYENEPLEQHITIFTDPYLEKIVEVRKELSERKTE